MTVYCRSCGRELADFCRFCDRCGLAQPNADELVQSRINTRESSTLTFATVGASASLVFLGLTIENSYPWWIPHVGIAFAVLGFVYREITIWSTDRTDYDKLPPFLREISEKWPAAFARRAILRLFLLLPILAWIAFAWDFSFMFAIVGAVAVVVAVVVSVFETVSSLRA